MNNLIEKIMKKVQSKLCILCKLRRHISEHTALQIYKTLIVCHMNYGDFLVDSGIKANIDKLDWLQVRNLRCIEYRFDVDGRRELPDLYHRYKLEPLVERRKHNLVKSMYSESKNDANIDMYRPTMELRSSNHKFNRLMNIQKSPY